MNTNPSRAAAAVHTAFWFLVFVIFPLALNPVAWSASAGIEEIVLQPKLIVLAAAWVVGLTGVALSHPGLRLASLPRLIGGAPWPLRLMLAFMGVITIGAAFVGDEPSVTLLGDIGRLDGVLVQLMWYSLVFPAFVLARADIVEVRRVFGIIALGGACTGGWVILQVHGIEPAALVMGATASGVLPTGPLGHGAVTTSYLAIVLLTYCAYLSRRDPPSLSPTSLAAVAVVAASIAAAGGRTGLVAVAVLWPLLLLAARGRRAALITLVRLTVLILVVGAAAVLTKPVPQREAQMVRVAEVAQGRDNSFNARLRFWPAAVRGIIDRPLVGVGPAGFNGVFWRYATPEERTFVVRSHIHEPIDTVIVGTSPLYQVKFVGSERFVLQSRMVDKAHNYLLDVAVAAGLPAAMLLVLLLATGIMMLARSPAPSAHGVLVGMSAAAVVAMVWFPALALDPIVWALFGLGLGSAIERERARVVPVAAPTLPRV